MASLGRWTGGTITSLIPTTSWAAPNGLFPTQDRNDNSDYSFTSSTSTLTLPSTIEPDGFLIRATVETTDSSNGRYIPQGKFVQASGTGNFLSLQTSGYSRDTSENRAFVHVCAVIDGPSASATIQFQWRSDTDLPAATDGTANSAFEVIPLYYNNISMYTGTTAAIESGATPNVVGLTSSTYESDTNAISRTGNVVTLKNEARYLVLGNVFKEGTGGTRTARNICFRKDSTPDYSACSQMYMRNASNDQNGAMILDVWDVGATDETLELACWGTGTATDYQPWAEVAGGTPTAQLNNIIAIELNDSAEVIRGHDTLTFGSATNSQLVSGTTPTDLNAIRTADFNDSASFTRVDNATINTEQDMDAFVGANVFTARAANATTTRHTGRTRITVNDTESATASDGWFCRGDQSTSGTRQGGANPCGFLDLTSGDDLGVSHARITGGETGDPSTVGLSIWAINLDTLAAPTTPAITDAGDEDFTYDETNITMTGTDFGATETGSAKVELGDSATYASATKVSQSVDTWSDTSIQFDIVPGALDQNNLWLYVTDSLGAVSPAYAVTVRIVPAITDAGDEDFTYDETNITLTGSGFGGTESGVAKVELGDSATYASATKVSQSIDTWSDTSIQFDIVPTGFTQNNLWLYTTNSLGEVSNAYAVTVRLIPAITDAGDEVFTVYETNITVTGTEFYGTQGTGTLELGDSATYATATKVTQSIDTWADTSIQFDLTIGSLDQESLWLYVTNDFGAVSNAYAVTVGLEPSITAVGDDSLTEDETNVTLTGDTFLNAIGTGKLELSDNATYATGTKVTQSIDTWGDTSIQFDVTIGSLTATTLYAWVTNDKGFRNATGYSFTMAYDAPPTTSYGPFTFDTANDTDCQEFLFASTDGQTTTNVIDSAGTAAKFCHDTNGGNSTSVGPDQGQGGVGDGYLYTECSSPGANDDEYTMEFDTDLDFSTHQWQFDFYTLQRGPTIGDNHSTCEVQVNEDGGGWTTITTFGGSGDDTTSGTAWTSRSVDLADDYTYLDSSTRVRLLITTDGPNNAWHGDYGIDTVELTGTPYPTITNAEDEVFTVYETNIVVTGTDFGASETGSAKLELCDSATYSSATKVSQSVDTWSDTSIQFDLTIGSLDQESLWLVVTDSTGLRGPAYAVTVELEPTITAVGDDNIGSIETNVVLTGDAFLNAIGSGKLELSDNATYATGTKVSQTIDSWANGSIQFDMVIGTLTDTTLYAWVTNDKGFRNATGYSFTVSYDTGPIITSVGTGIVGDTFTDIDIDGSDFEATQGTGKVILTDDATYDGGGTNNVEQTVNTWGDSLINIDIEIGPNTVYGTNYIYVITDDSGTSAGFEIELKQGAKSDGLYKTGGIVGVLNNAGYTTTVFLISDE